jgi:hypothetical protein
MRKPSWIWDVMAGAAAIGLGAVLMVTTLRHVAEPAMAVPAPSAPVQVATPCSTVPAPDTLNGTKGSTNCFIPGDATRPTAVQAANVTTDASGNWSVAFARPFTSSTPIIVPLPVNTGSLPMLCNVATRSSSGATGKCWQSNTTTLPGTLAGLAGMLVNPFSMGAANVPVTVIGREPTQ